VVLPKLLPDVPIQVTFDGTDAILGVVDPHPQFQVDGIIPKAHYKIKKGWGPGEPS
jgi:hypothetical protein